MNRIVMILFTAGLLVCAGPAWGQQPFGDLDRDRANVMLHSITKDVKKHYYDEKLNGADFDGRIRDAEERIKKATSVSQTMSIIAWTLDVLGDSHTYFVPPARSTRYDYGLRMQMVGDKCFVLNVRPGSDAETKGLKPGDQILSINNIAPDRENFHNIQYLFNLLRPMPSLKLQLRSPDGKERPLEVAAQIKQLKLGPMDLTSSIDLDSLIREGEASDRMERTRCVEMGDTYICKMAGFNLDVFKVRDLVGAARKKKNMILDLRGNGGGSVETLENMVGGVLENDAKIGERVGRKQMKPLQAKSMHNDCFTGHLVVLVDSGSASASEIFARMMQLEKRAKVIGDRSAGAVMEGRFYDYGIGADVKIFYGALITDADLIMSDGKSLERNGVTPDEVALPTGADLAAGLDPVMSRAAAMLGLQLSPAAAGKLFPYEWRKL
jgi:C-terminal processing protease CtpA/Prc